MQTFHSTVTFLNAGFSGKVTDVSFSTLDGVSGSKIKVNHCEVALMHNNNLIDDCDYHFYCQKPLISSRLVYVLNLLTQLGTVVLNLFVFMCIKHVTFRVNSNLGMI